jgi:hypothetical protein
MSLHRIICAYDIPVDQISGSLQFVGKSIGAGELDIPSAGDLNYFAYGIRAQERKQLGRNRLVSLVVDAVLQLLPAQQSIVGIQKRRLFRELQRGQNIGGLLERPSGTIGFINCERLALIAVTNCPIAGLEGSMDNKPNVSG